MIIHCTLCKSELPEGSEGAIAVLLKKYIESSWQNDWGRYSVGSQISFSGYKAEVIKMRDSWGDSVRYAYSHQGETFEAYIVFKVGDFFFMKKGTGDSYGEISWDGDFGPVQLKTKQITVYDF